MQDEVLATRPIEVQCERVVCDTGGCFELGKPLCTTMQYIALSSAVVEHQQYFFLKNALLFIINTTI